MTNGGVSDLASMVSDVPGTSIAPVASLGFSVPGGRKRTRPRTRTTNSLRSDSASPNVAPSAGSKVTCVIPSRSRTSMKIKPP